MDYIHHYNSPLGGITIASDGTALTGLWFDGQKYFAANLSRTGIMKKKTCPYLRRQIDGWIFILQGKTPALLLRC